MSEDSHRDDTGGHIAVTGLACRFPGADTPRAFWQNLVDGVDTVTRLPGRQLAGGSGRWYVPARGLLTGPEWFDAGYFGYSPREARILNPQHRVFLECGVEALEDAGCDPARYPGTIGVYAGGTETAYAQIIRSQRSSLPTMSDWEILLGNGPDFLASRLAYKLGLRGPSVTVQAACATSLVAVHLAIQALLSGDCDLALAGGAAVHVPAKDSRYADGGIISADGTCRTFDAAADGTVGADGVGVVALKRLADALADGDHIYAVIRGSAVNNDGSDRVGYTAPSVDGQAAAIADAQLVADVDPGTITYVEAHGTATPLGDPIEIAALTKAFGGDTERAGFCRIGSVKTNIGHTDTAAGAAGLIKTAMALEHGVIPPSLHFTAPNPAIDFAASPFRVATQLEQWQPDGMPRRAGVSAFGIGGTNAHLVLEEPPRPAFTGKSPPWQLLTLSAASPAALDAATARLAGHLRAHPGLSLADVAWTLQTGRREHTFRRVAIVRDTEDAVCALTDAGQERLVTADRAPQARTAAFMFPGASSACKQMSGLYRREPEFRRWADACLDAAPAPLAAIVRAAVRRGSAPADPVQASLVVFAREYALARLWIKWGVQPVALLGTGVGALVAAAVSDVFSLRDAVGLALEWGRLAGHPGASNDPGDQAAADFGDLVSGIAARRPQVPVVSAAHGRRLAAGEVADPTYWAACLRQAAYLENAVATLLASPRQVLVEVGTGTSLASLARRLPACSPDHVVISSLAGDAAPQGAAPSLLSAVGHLWLAGMPISWPGLHHGGKRRRVPLPTYPFERARHIVEPDGSFPSFGATPAAPGGGPDGGPGGGPGGGSEREGGTLPVVTRLFAQVLGLPEVDPDDSFFDLGGDSLIATDLLAEVERVFGVFLDLPSLYEAPTASGLTGLIGDQAAGPGASLAAS